MTRNMQYILLRTVQKQPVEISLLTRLIFVCVFLRIYLNEKCKLQGQKMYNVYLIYEKVRKTKTL